MGCGYLTSGHTLWTSTTPAWAPIRTLSPGKPGHWQPEPHASEAEPPEDSGVGERGWEEAQGRSPGALQLRDEKVNRGLEAQPGGRGSWGGGALEDPLWSLVKQVQNPFSREKKRYGLKGYMGVGACWPLGWPGAGGVFRHKEPACWGCQRWVGKEPKLNTDSQPVVTLPSVPSGLELALGESSS